MRLAPFPLAAVLLVSPASPKSPTRADDAADAKAIIEKAIKDHGHKPGAEPAVTTWKEKIAFNVSGQRMDFDSEWTVQIPDKMRFQGTTTIQALSSISRPS